MVISYFLTRQKQPLLAFYPSLPRTVTASRFQHHVQAFHSTRNLDCIRNSKTQDKIPHAPLLQTSFSKVNTFCGKIPSRPIYLWQGLTKKTGSVMPFTSRPPTSTVSRENTPANLRPDGGFDSPFCRTSLQSSPDLIHSCLLVWTNLGVTRKAQA